MTPPYGGPPRGGPGAGGFGGGGPGGKRPSFINRTKAVVLSGGSIPIAPSLAKAVAKKVIKLVIDKGIGI